MNAVSEIVKGFREFGSRIVESIGKLGSYAPIDDSKSGIK